MMCVGRRIEDNTLGLRCHLAIQLALRLDCHRETATNDFELGEESWQWVGCPHRTAIQHTPTEISNEQLRINLSSPAGQLCHVLVDDRSKIASSGRTEQLGGGHSVGIHTKQLGGCNTWVDGHSHILRPLQIPHTIFLDSHLVPYPS
jgi:hypothetical protein